MMFSQHSQWRFDKWLLFFNFKISMEELVGDFRHLDVSHDISDSARVNDRIRISILHISSDSHVWYDRMACVCGAGNS